MEKKKKQCMKGRNSVKDICLFQSICILIKLHCSPKFHMIRHFSEMEIRYEYALWGDWLWDHKFGSVKKNIFLLYILTQRCLRSTLRSRYSTFIIVRNCRSSYFDLGWGFGNVNL